MDYIIRNDNILYVTVCTIYEKKKEIKSVCQGVFLFFFGLKWKYPKIMKLQEVKEVHEESVIRKTYFQMWECIGYPPIYWLL